MTCASNLTSVACNRQERYLLLLQRTAGMGWPACAGTLQTKEYGEAEGTRRSRYLWGGSAQTLHFQNACELLAVAAFDERVVVVLELRMHLFTCVYVYVCMQFVCVYACIRGCMQQVC
jgi:hypothetical protein